MNDTLTVLGLTASVVVAFALARRRAGRRMLTARYAAAAAARPLPSNVTRLVDRRRPTFWNYEVDGD